MGKRVYEMETVDEMGRVISDIDVCLCLDELYRNYGSRLSSELSVAFGGDVANYLSERMTDHLEELKDLIAEFSEVEETRLKVS